MDREELRREYKLIAEFLGWKYVSNNGDNVPAGWYRPIKFPIENSEPTIVYHEKSPCYVTRKTLNLRFYYDWNRLMEVVNHIESLDSQRYGGFHIHIDSDCCLIQAKNRTKESTYSKMYCGNKDKRKAVYESILLFIEFWNK